MKSGLESKPDAVGARLRFRFLVLASFYFGLPFLNYADRRTYTRAGKDLPVSRFLIIERCPELKISRVLRSQKCTPEFHYKEVPSFRSPVKLGLADCKSPEDRILGSQFLLHLESKNIANDEDNCRGGRKTFPREVFDAKPIHSQGVCLTFPITVRFEGSVK